MFPVDYFYPRSPCGERRRNSQNINRGHRISIHALLAESDIIAKGWDRLCKTFLSTLSLRRATLGCKIAKNGITISIHALLAESDSLCMLYDTSGLIFLSTLSLRRATVEVRRSMGRPGDFYPRSPCGERRRYGGHGRAGLGISIHALLAESDQPQESKMAEALIFLSTLSLRRATKLPAPLTDCVKDFYPRSPCGERPGAQQTTVTSQSISIHALLAESDSKVQPEEPRAVEFLSTLSLRRATQ